jgi:CHAT domain-containing protein
VAAEIVATEDIVGLLRAGEAVVQILVADDATFVFLIRDDGLIRGHKVEVTTTQLQQAVSELRLGLDPSEGVQAFDLARAHQLYRSVLGSVDADLAGVEHLIFVPSGPLLSLPPAVLVRKAPGDGQDYQSAAWLVRDMATSVLPSIGALQELRAVVQQSQAPQPFLGVGDPSFGGEGDHRGALAQAASPCLEDETFDSSLLRGLAPLPETRDELRSLASSLGASDDSLVLGESATETTVRRANLDAYRIIAFATHGLLPNELRCLAAPALVLTPPRVARMEDDGLLTSSDVAQLKLDADWVVLSACNTAGPEGGLGGESLSGLARAFFYAGARALLVSHWAVESEPTVLLTTGTLARYAKEPTRGKAEALRQAELALLSRPGTAHPARWAPFVLIGDGGPRPTPDV